MNALEQEIKALIIECLFLEDVSVDDIQSEEALFGDGLGLDSIDALELGLALQKKYNCKIDAENEKTKENFESVTKLAQFVAANRS